MPFKYSERCLELAKRCLASSEPEALWKSFEDIMHEKTRIDALVDETTQPTPEPITCFQGQYRWLSNFGAEDVIFEGVLYPTSEHAYQAAKSLDPQVREQIRQAKTPGQAKRLGSKLELRPNWDKIKLLTMFTILAAKYDRHEHLRTQLLATGKAKLIEGNTWGDTYWGVCNGTGHNHLGRLLMMIRSLIQP